MDVQSETTMGGDLSPSITEEEAGNQAADKIWLVTARSRVNDRLIIEAYSSEKAAENALYEIRDENDEATALDLKERVVHDE
jgi:hypothetical protein